AAIDVAAGKHPFAVAGLDGATDEHDAARLAADDRADRDLGIDVEDEAARAADEPLGLGRFQQLALERPAAPWTKSIGVRVVVRLQREWRRRPGRHGPSIIRRLCRS